MKQIVFVKQYTGERHNDKTRFYVKYKKQNGENQSGQEYGLWNLPKSVKRFMKSHTCEQFDNDTDNDFISFIYR